MDAPWRLQLLGGLQATRGERTLSRFRTRKTGLLLAYLAYHPEHAHPRELLIERLWPGCDPDTGRNNLRVALSSLRHQLELPAGLLTASRAAVQLHRDACRTDVAAFEAALGAAAGARSSLERIDGLGEAAGRYGGELLPGFFEAWIEPERQRLAEAYLGALRQLARELAAAGEHARALHWARRAVCADPLCEESQCQLIALLAAAGETDAARCQYQQFERLLAQELGIEPSPELRTLAAGLAAPVEAGKRKRSERTADQQHDVATAETRATTTGSLTARPALPSGTLTCLLTEIEGSAALREWLGPHFTAAESEHRSLLRPLFDSRGGQVIRDAAGVFVVLFADVADALAAAVAGQRLLAAHPWSAEMGALRVRMALHTGDVEADGDGTGSAPAVGICGLDCPTLQHAGRLLRAANGGQVLLSAVTAALFGSPRPRLVDLGLFRLREESPPERLFQWDDPDRPPAGGGPVHARPALSPTLPREVTRFFGREAEIERLRALIEAAEDGGRQMAAGGLEAAGASGAWATAENYRPPSAVPRPPSPARRLVTLTGPGGSGKTRLALAAVGGMIETFRGAVWFVPLHDLTAPAAPDDDGDGARALILDRLQEVLQLSRLPGREPLDPIAAFLSRQPSLLLLDNFEPWVEAGAPLVRALLDRVDHLTLLVTSRHRLNLAEEREFPVAPLPVPGDFGFLNLDFGLGSTEMPSAAPLPPIQNPNAQRGPEIQNLDALAACPSVALFVDRARAVRPDFALTAANAAAAAELCVRLEGLPLAIELAAARVGVLSPSQMLAWLPAPEAPALAGPAPRERLRAGAGPAGGRFALLNSRQRDRLARHRSLRAALDGSFCLLSPELQQFFARLSVFRGGFTLDAAAAVCSDSGVRVLEWLEQLLDSSLVHAEEAGGEGWSSLHGACRTEQRTPSTEPPAPALRFRLLETLREYGAEQLGVEEAAAVARRHLDYFVALAEAAAPELVGADQVLWLERLEREHANLRVAMEFAVTHGAVEEGLRLGGALWRFAGLRDHVPEWRQRVADLLALPAAAAPVAARVEALVAAGMFAYWQGDLSAALPLAEEAGRLGRQQGEAGGLARALNLLGIVQLARGDLPPARALLEESLRLSRAAEDRHAAAMTLSNLGNLACAEGDGVSAEWLRRESLVLLRALGSKASIGIVLGNLGAAAREAGDLAAAHACYSECLTLARELGNRSGIGFHHERVGEIALLRHDYAAAAAHLEESLAVMRDAASPRGAVVRTFLLGAAALGLGDRERALACFQQCLSCFQQPAHLCPPLEIGDWLQQMAALVIRLVLSAPRPADGVPHGTPDPASTPPTVGFFAGPVAREWAVRMAGAGAARRAGPEAPPFPKAACERDSDLAAFDPHGCAAAWRESQEQPWEQAVTFAVARQAETPRPPCGH